MEMLERETNIISSTTARENRLKVTVDIEKTLDFFVYKCLYISLSFLSISICGELEEKEIKVKKKERQMNETK